MPDLKITVIRADRKTLAIQLKNGEIIARAPLRMKEKDIYNFIETKKPWIEKHLVRMSEQQKALEKIEPFTEKEIKALYERARLIVQEKVKYYAPLVGVTYGRITIR